MPKRKYLLPKQPNIVLARSFRFERAPFKSGAEGCDWTGLDTFAVTCLWYSSPKPAE